MNTNYVLIDFENVQPESLELLTADHFRVVVFVGARQNCVPLETVRSLQPFGSRVEYVKISRPGPNSLDFHIAYYLGRLAVVEPTAHFHVVSKDTGFDPLIEHLRSQRMTARRVGDVAAIAGVKSIAKSTVTSNARSVDESTPSSSVRSVSESPLRVAGAPTATSVAPPTASHESKQPGVNDAIPSVTRPTVSVSKPKISTTNQERITKIVTRLKPMTKPKTVKTLSSTIAAIFRDEQVSPREVAALIQGLVNRGYLKTTANRVTYSLSTAE